jgi:simple sugar transport system permease protein
MLFNAMFIVSPAIGRFFASDEGVGEYTRSFMVYGVIGLALGLYIWKGLKAERDKEALE